MIDFSGEFTVETRSGLRLRYTVKENNGEVAIACRVFNRGANTMDITIADIEEDGKRLIDAAKYLKNLISLKERAS